MELSVTLLEPHRRGELFGAGDRHLRRIRDRLGVRLMARNATLRLEGEPGDVAKAAAVIERLQDILKTKDYLDDELFVDTLEQFTGEQTSGDPNAVRVFTRDQVIPRTEGQRRYVQAMLEKDLVICVGPAGTGKTYLAVAVAVHMLKAGQIKRIALVRPAVEAGEKLGFLPGDFQQKVNPYLRPLFDAMHDMMTFDQMKRFMVSDIVEVIPLAYMRGRTLNHAAIILDEAQNATPQQMLMFLTRLGHHSRMIVTGDDSQVDLDPGKPSGLIDAVRRLRGCPGVEVLRLADADIVRHRLVQDIVARYAQSDRPTGGYAAPDGARSADRSGASAAPRSASPRQEAGQSEG